MLNPSERPSIEPITAETVVKPFHPNHTCFVQYPELGTITFRDEIDAHAQLRADGLRESGDLSTDEYSRVARALTRRIKALVAGLEEPAR